MIRSGGAGAEHAVESVGLLVQEQPEAEADVAGDREVKKKAAAPAKILFLDGVRGLAALLVVSQHSHEYMQDLNLGACAVDAFFVLSSFLLTMLFTKKSIKLLASGASYRTWAFTLLDYLSKRFFRVYPLLALTATVLWVLPDDDKRRYYLIDQPERFDLFNVLTFDFDSRYFVLWTLPLEITYYFFIPLFVLAVLRLRSLWWTPFVPAYVWVVYEGWTSFRWDHMALLPHAPTFLAGSMAAVIFVKLDTWMETRRVKPRPAFLCFIRVVEYTALAVLLSLSLRGLLFHWVHANIAPETPGFPFTSLLLTVLFVVELLLPSALSAVFEWSALRYCGKVSFSVYLLHGFVIYADAVRNQPSYYDRLVARFGLTLLLATVSYHLVEYPSQRLAQHITRELAKREARAPTPGVLDAIARKLAASLRSEKPMCV
jgi:peptidoglycan/LPS O-acetylase OafA/YrhL